MLKLISRSDLRRCLVPLLLLLAREKGALAAEKPNVPVRYQKFFFHYVDRRSLSEKVLNVVGLTSGEVGRSFALIAGVDIYPSLPQRDRSLPAAAVDIRKLKSYLRDVESFDEIVVLQNDAVTDDNLKYFLQAYFPSRLHEFPNSRFLLAYSGHGIQDGPRGYLLQASATSFHDKANSISLEVLRTMYEEIVDSAYQSLALINACHGGFFSRAPFGPERRLLPRGPGAHAITAGGSHERSWSDGRPDHGSIFFEKLFAGLEGRADRLPDQPKGPPGDGIITEQELYAYLLQEVQLETDQKQNPQENDLYRDGSTGSFFFLNRAREVISGAIKPWNPNQNGARSMGDDVYSSTSPTEKPQEPTSDLDILATSTDLGEINNELQRRGFSADVYFERNSTLLSDWDRDHLARNAELLRNYPQLTITIEGHAEASGSSEYNLALGERRVNVVRDFLTSIGISVPRMRAISYGKERPVCTDRKEACDSQNRRVHIVITGFLQGRGSAARKEI